MHHHQRPVLDTRLARVVELVARAADLELEAVTIMAEYQNIFTQVTVHGPRRPGCAAWTDMWVAPARVATSCPTGCPRSAMRRSGPFYLGGLGVASLVCGFIAFEIIGLNMWASVGWDPIEFVRQLPWLALEPPSPEYGLSSSAA